jgi:hypothetical protein
MAKEKWSHDEFMADIIAKDYAQGCTLLNVEDAEK